MTPRPDEEGESVDRQGGEARGVEFPNRWGKLNAGQSYHILAKDIDRAIGLANLGAYEAFILQHVREKTWGVSARVKKGRDNPWPEARRCMLNASELSGSIGLHRQRLVDAKASLLRAKILVEHDDKSLSINKAVDQWIFPKTGKLRFTARMINFFAQSWPVAQGQLTLDPFEGERPSDRARGHLVTAPEVRSDRARGHPHIGSPALEDFPEERRECVREGPAHTSASLSKAEDRPPSEISPVVQGELAAVAVLCGTWFPSDSEIARAVAERHGGYSVAWYSEAAIKLRHRPREQHVRAYFMAILKNLTEGRPTGSRNVQASSPPFPIHRASPEVRDMLASLKTPGRDKL